MPDDGYLLSEAFVKRVARAVRSHDARYATQGNAAPQDGPYDAKLFAWVNVPSDVAPGEHVECTIVRNGETTSDTIDVWNRWPLTTAQSGSRWLAVFVDDEWAFAPGECAP